ncbi:alpha/beta hydrolase [Ideonella sp. A 288]|uniref:RBBP9/YdeN family alpha/beta hydrolase n=1 Tax=Ideonella sp. A 288 TaxID=1962181 RepID=UPI000B4BF4FF|nr:alpha/beta fold hydrolase [Ideonella sp. A 288]
MTDTRWLLLPGWLDSGPDHWQSRWERLHGWQRVVQDDWQWPRRGDWMARLEDTLLQDERPAVLLAHSLGCHLVAAWAAHSSHTRRVVGALLVAPPDTERADMPPQLFNWRPMVRQPLPFTARVVHSSDDPFCHPDTGRALAAAWRAAVTDLGPRGHVNAESGLGDWPEGEALARALAAPPGG